MCGRFTIAVPAAEIAELLGLPNIPPVRPRYNVAPSQQILAARLGEDGKRQAALLRWGLVPWWANDKSIGYKLINARSETIAGKPSFRDAYRKRRCVIPADGFFEWKAEGKKKRPFRFHRPGGKPFVFAGLWERWAPGDEEPLETCTIVTTAANATVKPFHDRMPVILDAVGMNRWLAPGALKEEESAELLQGAADDFLIAEEVSPVVNSPKIDGPECVVPVGKSKP